MARGRGIESSKVEYLSPSILLLFVLRYDDELYVSDRDTYLKNSFYRSFNDFRLAIYVSKRLSEFDFRNFEWHIHGDKLAHGNAFRVFHPISPGRITAKQSNRDC